MTASSPCAVFFVLGATGSGKSAVAVQLAQALMHASPQRFDDVVVVNCDVSQCFADLPVATNKPTREDMAGVPHVFVGYLAHDGSTRCAPDVPYEGCDVAHDGDAATITVSASHAPRAYTVHDYVDAVTAYMARYAAQHPRGAVVVCGGTCYYAQALLFANALVQEDAEGDEDDNDSSDDDTLWQRVQAVDAEAAARYHPHDVRRLRRLLQLYCATGAPPSRLFATRAQPRLRYDAARCYVLLTHTRDDVLRSRLDARVDAMVQRGLLREAAALRSRVDDASLCTTLRDVIGYKELAELHDDDDAVATARALERVKGHTRRYARQQRRWLRNRIVPQLATVTSSEDGTDSSSSAARLRVSQVVQLDTTDGVDATRVRDVLAYMLHNDGGVTPPPSSCVQLPLRDAAATKSTTDASSARCDVCDTVVYGAANVAAHATSRRHRAALQRRARERAFAARFGQPLPPPRKRRRV